MQIHEKVIKGNSTIIS